MKMRAVHTVQAKDANHATVTIAPGQIFDCAPSEAERLVKLGAAVDPDKEQVTDTPSVVTVLPAGPPPKIEGQAHDPEDTKTASTKAAEAEAAGKKPADTKDKK
jgi:hypothetical protein